ncbi:MAG: VOC family protein [Pseudomonadota bacterium]
MGRTVHFEIQATQPQVLIDFYSALFGWNFTPWEGERVYWLIGTGPRAKPGIDGGLLPRCDGPSAAPPPPALADAGGTGGAAGASINGFVCTVEVDDVERAMAQGVALGGHVAKPMAPVAGVGWLAYLTDPDGNLFGMMQSDASVPEE